MDKTTECNCCNRKYYQIFYVPEEPNNKMLMPYTLLMYGGIVNNRK